MDFGYNIDEVARLTDARAPTTPGLGTSYLNRPSARATLDRLRAMSGETPYPPPVEIMARPEATEPLAPALTFKTAVEYVARTIHDDGGKHFVRQLVEAVGRDTLAAALKPRPNLTPFPLDFTTLEVSIWDNLPVSCPLLSGPSTMTVWTEEGTTNACEEAQARGDHRQAA